MNSLGSVQHTISYDAVKNWVRWDRSGNVERQGVQETIITWTDYNKLVEYVYWVEENVCEPYGPDAFYEWCYGEKVSQTYTGAINVAGQTASNWKLPNTGFQWTSLNNQCMPLSTAQLGGFTTNFFNSTVGAPGEATWSLPTACQKAGGGHRRGALARSETPFFLVRP